ncbi:hypothetical protein ACE6H2_015288 [Prunus campanulata]
MKVVSLRPTRIAAQIEVLSLRPARNAARIEVVSPRPARIAAQIEELSLRPARNAARLTLCIRSLFILFYFNPFCFNLSYFILFKLFALIFLLLDMVLNSSSISSILCPPSFRDIRTGGARTADQVDQMSPKSSEDYKAGRVTNGVTRN